MKQNTKRLYSMIFALLFLVAALIVYFDMLAPAYADLQTAKGNEISEQNLLSNEQQIAQEFQGLLTTYKGDGAQVQAVSVALPVGPDVANALAQIYGIAGSNNVSVQNLSISTNQGQTASGSSGQGGIVKPAGTLSFSLSLTGSYENFKNFLRALESNIRIFDVKQVSFQAANTSGGKGVADLFTYNLSVDTYYQSP